jgi:hypothetical protein
MACCTPKNPFIGPFQINVLRRQEIDYQFYFILSIASLTPPKKNKKKKKKWGLLVDLNTPKTRHRIHICQSNFTVEVKFPANSTINTWDHNTTHFNTFQMMW